MKATEASVGCAEPRHMVQVRRVLMITYDFPPSPLMGAQACAQIARYLPEYGWEPVVLTVAERYVPEQDTTTMEHVPTKIYRTRVLPHVFDLYRKAKGLVRATDDSDRPGSGWGQSSAPRPAPSRLRLLVLSLLSTPDTFSGWLPVAVARGWNIVGRERIEHIFSSAPSFTNHLVGLVLKRLTGRPWTAHFRDPWSHWKEMAPPGEDVTPASLELHRWLERRVVKHADWVVCVTARHTEAMRRTYPDLPAGKFVTIPNGYSPEEFESVRADKPVFARDSGNQFTITYTGEFYVWRDPTPLFRALGALIAEGELTPDEVVMNLVGRCNKAQGLLVAEIAKGMGLDGVVRLRGQVSRREAIRYMVESDLLLVLAERFELQVPGKTYEYLRAGKPILALATDGATADLIRVTGGGEVVSPDDVPRIAKVIRRLMQEREEGRPLNGANLSVVKRFDRRRLTGELASLFSASACSAPTFGATRVLRGGV